MVDLIKEQADLAKADADIAEGNARLSRQAALVEELERDGHDATEARKFLAMLRATLKEWHAHRAQIVRMIEQADPAGDRATNS